MISLVRQLPQDAVWVLAEALHRSTVHSARTIRALLRHGFSLYDEPYRCGALLCVHPRSLSAERYGCNRELPCTLGGFRMVPTRPVSL